jgi:K(+)-stimulated pyrophosphate-energized sodium pump
VQLLVWIFVMRVMMCHRQRRVVPAQRRLGESASTRRSTMNFETPLTTLVWLTSIVSSR